MKFGDKHYQAIHEAATNDNGSCLAETLSPTVHKELLRAGHLEKTVKGYQVTFKGFQAADRYARKEGLLPWAFKAHIYPLIQQMKDAGKNLDYGRPEDTTSQTDWKWWWNYYLTTWAADIAFALASPDICLGEDVATDEGGPEEIILTATGTYQDGSTGHYTRVALLAPWFDKQGATPSKGLIKALIQETEFLRNLLIDGGYLGKCNRPCIV